MRNVWASRNGGRQWGGFSGRKVGAAMGRFAEGLKDGRWEKNRKTTATKMLSAGSDRKVG